jgi:predicted metalloprotease with PDZ domain
MAAQTISIQRGAGGYGFNLSRVGGFHVFRHVDEAGAAFAAGARVGDSILAVSGGFRVGRSCHLREVHLRPFFYFID